MVGYRDLVRICNTLLVNGVVRRRLDTFNNSVNAADRPYQGSLFHLSPQGIDWIPQSFASSDAFPTPDLGA
jgi:hypothetical protein